MFSESMLVRPKVVLGLQGGGTIGQPCPCPCPRQGDGCPRQGDGGGLEGGQGGQGGTGEEARSKMLQEQTAAAKALQK